MSARHSTGTKGGLHGGVRGQGSPSRLHKRSAEDAKATCEVLDPEGEVPFFPRQLAEWPKGAKHGTHAARDGGAGTPNPSDSSRLRARTPGQITPLFRRAWYGFSSANPANMASFK